MSEILKNGDSAMRILIAFIFGILQALVVAILVWVGSTVSSLNRESGELKQRRGEEKMTDEQPRAHDGRAEDLAGWRKYLCWIARRLSEFWDFVDNRDIDKHVVAIGITVFMLDRSIRKTVWGWQFADRWLELAKEGKAISGTEIAAVIAAVLGPWSVAVSIVLAAVTAFYFKARQK